MSSQQCPGCGETVTPHRLDLAQSKPSKNGEPGGGYFMAAKCPNCGVALGRAEPAAPPPAPAAPDLTGVIGLGGLIGQDRAAQLAPEAASLVERGRRRRALRRGDGVDAPAPRVPATPPADDIVSMATARLAFVEAEIAKLRGYEDERALLERMIAAAAPQSAEREAS